MLTILSHLKDAFRISMGGPAPDWEAYLHAGSSDREYTVAMDVDWTDNTERALIRQYFTMIFQRRGISQYLAPSGVREDRWYAWCQLASDMLDDRALTPLYSGRLQITCWPDNQSWEAVYIFRVNGTSYRWGLGWPGRTSDILSRDMPGVRWYGNHSLALANGWFQGLSEDARKSLESYLKGEIDERPHLLWDWNTVCSPLDEHDSLYQKIWTLEASTENLDDQHQPAFRQVMTATQSKPGQNQVISGTKVMYALIKNGLVVVPNRRAELQPWVPLTDLETPPRPLADLDDLPRYLFQLKNGYPDEKRRYDQICKTFIGLTKRQLDVSATRDMSDHDSSGLAVHIHVTSSPLSALWVPLERSGSGIEETAYWAAIAHAPGLQVVALDEPGANLHPDLQQDLRQAFARSTSQIFVVTHSPYFLDADWLPSTFHCKQIEGATAIHQGVEYKKRKGKTLRDLVRRSADMRALLFATRVLLVEGESEAAAIPVWFRKARIAGLESLSQAGVMVQWIGGKGNAEHYLRLLETFHVPWTYFCDGDALLSGGGNVFAALKRAGISVARGIRTQAVDRQKEGLQPYNVWIRGDTVTDCFETLPEYRNLEKAMAKQDFGGSKVLRAQWVAERSPCPQEFEALFRSLVAN